jgi:uncharacterized membrane protein
MRVVGPGHALFAIAVAGLAILSLAYSDFAPIWQPLPALFPWRKTCVYGSGLLVLAASAGLCFSRTSLASAVLIGAYLAAWAATRAVPIAVEPLSIAAWYGLCEALAPLLAAGILCTALQRRIPGAAPPTIASARAVRVAQVLFGLACAGFGLAHFAFAGLTASMVPVWLPGRLGFAYFTGLCHVAAGIGIAVAILPRLAATLEATMMSSFGLLVWVPSFFAHPTPAWAAPARNQWSELVVTLLLAGSGWIVAASMRNRPWR